MILALDTATLQAGVALVSLDGQPLAVRRARVTTHSEGLLALVDEVLHEALGRGGDAALAALTAIACGAGPGSFTGLRIGLATAKGLCLATSKPLLVVSSLQALALRAPEGALAVPVLDAFKGEVYAGCARRGPGFTLTALAAETVLDPAQLAAELNSLVAAEPARSIHLIGDGLAHWPVLDVPGLVTADTAPPDPVDVGRLAALRISRGERDDLAAAVPAYIRPSEVELKQQGPRKRTLLGDVTEPSKGHKLSD